MVLEDFPTEQAVFIFCGLWCLLFIAYLLGFDSVITELFRTVSGVLVGYLMAKMNIQKSVT